MSNRAPIIFDQALTEMVKSLSKIELKDEIERTAEMIEETQYNLSVLLAYKDFLYREAWCRGQREEHENED